MGKEGYSQPGSISYVPQDSPRGDLERVFAGKVSTASLGVHFPPNDY